MLKTKNNGGEFTDTCCTVLCLTHEEDHACGDDAGTKPPPMHHICLYFAYGRHQTGISTSYAAAICLDNVSQIMQEKTVDKTASHAWSTHRVWDPHRDQRGANGEVNVSTQTWPCHSHEL